MAEIPTTVPIDVSEGIQEYGRTLRGENKTTRTVLAAALCDAMNGTGTWECLPPSGGRESWLHRADKVIRALAHRNYLIAGFDEVKDV